MQFALTSRISWCFSWLGALKYNSLQKENPNLQTKYIDLNTEANLCHMKIDNFGILS